MGTTYASQVIDEETAKPRNTFWREMPILLGVAVVVAVLVRAFVLQTFFIPSESMEHTLNIDDRVLVNKVVYDFRGPHRGEIIVFTSPLEWRSTPDEEDFIKRVIGVGGDRVSCDAQHKIEVNGKALDESSYLYVDKETGRQAPACDEKFDVTVPKGRLWVMGDNREHSGDSRENYLRNNHDIMHSTISEDAVIGRAFVLFWPVGSATWLSVPSTFDKVPAAAGQ
jgi:signal peptidase I